MRYYVRLASKAVWNGEAPTAEQRETARRTLALREGESGLSLWEVSNDDDLALIIAATACTKKRIVTTDFLQIDESFISALGTIATTEGDSPLAEANALHRELKWPPGVIRDLVDRLLDARLGAIRYNRAKVFAAVCSVDPAAKGMKMSEWERLQQGRS